MEKDKEKIRIAVVFNQDSAIYFELHQAAIGRDTPDWIIALATDNGKNEYIIPGIRKRLNSILIFKLIAAGSLHPHIIETSQSVYSEKKALGAVAEGIKTLVGIYPYQTEIYLSDLPAAIESKVL